MVQSLLARLQVLVYVLSETVPWSNHYWRVCKLLYILSEVVPWSNHYWRVFNFLCMS